MHEAKVGAVQRRVRRDLAVRFGVCRRRFRIGGLEPKTAGNLDRTEYDLKRVQRAACLESVCVGRNPAHGMKGNRTADHLLMLLATEVRPVMIQFERFFEGDARQFGRNGADAFR